tara:strand:+ start:3711 stop:4358 length:648 start_codon:yes stop_codon:yes gene_type:complete
MKPSYYAIIPAEVRYSDLKPNAKLLYGEITALSSKEGYCFATNNYFAKLYNVTKNTISLWVSQLNNQGFVSVELIKKGEQITERRIGIIKIDDRPIIKNKDLSNIKINNKNNISIRKLKFINNLSLLDFDNNLKEEFKNYWIEYNSSKTKMRFELEKTWNLQARIMRWKKLSEKWNKNSRASKKYTSTSKLESTISAHQSSKEMIDQMNNKNILR